MGLDLETLVEVFATLGSRIFPLYGVFTQWTTDLSSKVNLRGAINCKVLSCSNLITLQADIWGNEILVVHVVAPSTLIAEGLRLRFKKKLLGRNVKRFQGGRLIDFCITQL